MGFYVFLLLSVYFLKEKQWKKERSFLNLNFLKVGHVQKIVKSAPKMIKSGYSRVLFQSIMKLIWDCLQEKKFFRKKKKKKQRRAKTEKLVIFPTRGRQFFFCCLSKPKFWLTQIWRVQHKAHQGWLIHRGKKQTYNLICLLLSFNIKLFPRSKFCSASPVNATLHAWNFKSYL